MYMISAYEAFPYVLSIQASGVVQRVVGHAFESFNSYVILIYSYLHGTSYPNV
jgi:hypothetical protein